MGIDLKPYFDSARSADDEVQRVMAEMNAAFGEGTPEGKQKALDQRPALDAAKQAAEAANALYVSMRDASSVSSGVARNFVPVQGTEVGGAALPSEMKRGDFLALQADERMKFIKGGGKVVD
jgi:hypothetical protein